MIIHVMSICPLCLHDQRRLFHLPPPAPCYPILVHQGCKEHQADHFICYDEEAGEGVPCSPFIRLRGWWAHPGAGKGFIPLLSSEALLICPLRRAARLARRCQDETWCVMPPNWHLRERACARAGGSRRGSSRRHARRQLRLPSPWS